MLDSTEVEEVRWTELVELLGLAVVEFALVSLPSVMLGLGLRLGIAAEVPVVEDPSSLLIPTKRVAAARSRHRQRQSNALAPEARGSNMAHEQSNPRASCKEGRGSTGGREATLGEKEILSHAEEASSDKLRNPSLAGLYLRYRLPEGESTMYVERT